MDWINKEDNNLTEDTCCLVKLKGEACIEKAIYLTNSDTFCLDNPGARVSLMPLDIEKFFVIPEW